MTVLKNYLNNVYIINVFKYRSDNPIFSVVKKVGRKKTAPNRQMYNFSFLTKLKRDYHRNNLFQIITTTTTTK